MASNVGNAMLKNSLVDAKTLRNNNIQKSYIDDILRDIISNINTELKIAKSNGDHYIITEIPLIFNIPNTHVKDSQRIIWSALIALLKNKNYGVIIDHNTNSCRLKITWLAPADESLIQSQLRLLNECTGEF
jgi:hypothetical protein